MNIFICFKLHFKIVQSFWHRNWSKNNFFRFVQHTIRYLSTIHTLCFSSIIFFLFLWSKPSWIGTNTNENLSSRGHKKKTHNKHATENNDDLIIWFYRKRDYLLLSNVYRISIYGRFYFEIKFIFVETCYQKATKNNKNTPAIIIIYRSDKDHRLPLVSNTIKKKRFLCMLCIFTHTNHIHIDFSFFFCFAAAFDMHVAYLLSYFGTSLTIDL